MPGLHPTQRSKKCSSLGQAMGLHHPCVTSNVLCKAERSREAATAETLKAEEKARPSKREKEEEQPHGESQQNPLPQTTSFRCPARGQGRCPVWE